MKARKLFIVAEGDIDPATSTAAWHSQSIREGFRTEAVTYLKGSAHAQFIFDTPEGERLLRDPEVSFRAVTVS
jgi:hypothetical protein